jgi:hypothetical protein
MGRAGSVKWSKLELSTIRAARMKSKYEPLRRNLLQRPRGEFWLSFRQIEELLGFSLPERRAKGCAGALAPAPEHAAGTRLGD